MRYLIGTSGWQYDDWQGKFYPQNLPRPGWLGFYAGRFSTVEVNSSFYHLPQPETLTRWYQATPPGFFFSLKASRFITHNKKLRDTQEAVARLAELANMLKEKLGAVLYQLPPGLKRNDETLESFLSILPRGVRHAIEFRHPSWFEDGVEKILRRNGVGFCVFDMPGLTSPVTATADFGYVRFHGAESLYASSYTNAELKDWAGRLKALPERVKEVYIYFNNDVAGFALDNAITVRGYLES